MSHYCEKCGRTMDDKQFYTSKNLEKYPPDGKLNLCKSCITMHIDNWDPETYKWILEEIDIPYIKSKWDEILKAAIEKKGPDSITGMTVIGKYISQMKLKQYKQYGWADTEMLAEEERQKKIGAMRAQGMSQEEIDTNLAIDRTPEKPKFAAVASPAGTPAFIEPEDVHDEYSDQLTDEDKIMLRTKWGRGYTCEQWVKLEQKFTNFENSYDIQTAGHKDTLIMVCKASLKANELMDAGDIDGAQKMTKVYDSLMKSGNFQAVQNKNVTGEGIDSVGEIVRLAEQRGFIPRYYTGGPKDKADKILVDLQHYTKTLITEELNLGNMIEAAVAANAEDKKREERINLDDAEDEDEVVLDDYQEDKVITDEEYQDFLDRQQELKEQSEAISDGFK